MAVKSPASALPTVLALLPLGLLAAAGPHPARAQAAQVDRSTPHTQNGLTLIAIVRGDGQGQYRFPVPGNLSFLSGPSGFGPPGGLGLWIKGGAVAAVKAGGGGFSRSFSMQMPTFGARGAGGETLPVQAQPQFTPSPNGQSSTAPLYFVSLPGGYPDGYGPIDVTMNDVQGRHAHWRLGHLPPSYHAIAGTVTPHPAFTHGGVTLHVRAWRDNGPPDFGPNANSSSMAEFRGVGYRIDAVVPPKTQWAIHITKQQLEWEPLHPGEGPMNRYPPNYPQPAQFTGYFGQAPAGAPPGFAPQMQNTVRTPYGAHDRYLRLTGQLVQVATAQETLTFHDLTVHPRPNPYANAPIQRGPNGRPMPRYTPPPSYEVSSPPQTAVTPSGISVTLLSPSSLPQNQGLGLFGGGGIQMVFKFNGTGPGMVPTSLPRSPLARQYHKPVAFTLQAPPSYFLQGMFPVGGYSPQRGASGQEFMAALVQARSRPTFVTRPNAPRGARFPVFTPPVVPRRIAALTFTVSQRAELRAIPVSFLVPVGNDAPPSPYPSFRAPQFPRRALMPGRPK